MSAAAHAPLVLWRFTDSRRGHDAQSRGLALALAELRPVRICDIPVPSAAQSVFEFLLGRCAAGATLPDPHLLIGAGHGTHLALLAARRARGGRIVLLMRPSLPTRCFDLCLVPDHDGMAEQDNIVLTRGPLNAIRSPAAASRSGGLILLGGESRHYRWTETAVMEQLRAVLATPGPWTIGDSPRTPAATRARLRDLSGVRYVAWDEGGPRDLARELTAAERVWVSADSLSMIYEALTAGAAVGVIELPPARAGSRAQEALRRLRSEGWLTVFSDWRPGAQLHPPPATLDEAGRCAELVLRRLC